MYKYTKYLLVKYEINIMKKNNKFFLFLILLIYLLKKNYLNFI